MSMLNQLFAAGLIPSAKHFRKLATPIGTTRVAAVAKTPPQVVEEAAVAVANQEIESLEDKEAVGGPLVVPASDSVSKLDDNVACNLTEYDCDSYVKDTLTYVATEYGSSTEIDSDDDSYDV